MIRALKMRIQKAEKPIIRFPFFSFRGIKISFRQLFIFFLFVLLASTVSADFSAYSDHSDINVCEGEVFEQKIHIQSEFAQPTAFNIKQQNKDLSGRLVPDRFSLPPGGETTVSHFISNVEEGNYESRLLIEAGGTKKAISQDVSVEKCQKISVNAKKYSYSNCPCTPTVYMFNLTNTGSSPEIFDLFIDAKDSYYKLSQDAAFISPEETVPVYVFMNLPCEKTGNFTFKFKTEAQSTGVVTETPFFLQLRESCYDFELERGDANLTKESNTPQENFTFPVNETYNFCLNNTYEIPLELTNNGEVNNSYKIIDRSPWFIQTLFYNRTLGVNESFKGYIKATPTNISEGEYTSEIEIVTNRGEVAKQYNINYYVDDCRIDNTFEQLKFWFYVVIAFIGLLVLLLLLVSLYLILRKPREQLPVTKETKEEASKSSRKFLVLIAALIVLVLLLLGLFYFIPWSSTFQPAINETNQTSNVSAGKEPVHETIAENETLENLANETQGNQTTAGKKGFISQAARTSAQYLNIYKYYILLGLVIFFIILLLFKYKPGKEWLNKKYSGKPVKKETKGTKKAKGETPKGSNKLWILIAALIVLILLLLGLFYFTPWASPAPEEVNKTNRTGDASRKVPVNETLAKNENVKNQSQMNETSTNKTGLNLSFVEPAKTTVNYLNIYKYYILAGLVLLGLILIIFAKKPIQASSDQIYKYIILVFALVIILLLISLFFYTTKSNTVQEKNQTLSLEENSTHYVMNKNTEKTIDFDPYVHDEEGNVTLKATPMQNISVNITGTNVKLIPDQGWYGKDVFNLIATDEMGARAYSPDISVIVLNREPWHKMLWNNTKTFFSDFGYVILILLGVGVIVALLLYYVKK